MKPANPGIASLKALGMVVALGAVARAGMPYLPLIGPPPVRVQAEQKSAATFMAVGKIPALASTDSHLAGGAKILAANTNSEITPALTPMPAVPVTTEISSSPGVPVMALSAPDLICVTPEMLATYFQPVLLGTNAPVPMSFLPPLPPDNSSHAEYEVK